MPLGFGNPISRTVHRGLAKSSGNLTRAFESLSSGKRINRASDDAAGLAIASSLSSKTRISNQALRNVNDAISIVNITDSAAGHLSDIVTRLQELAEQSANGVYSSTQRLALDKEAQSLAGEYNRILGSTEFNGKKLMNGSVSSVQIQVGEDASADSRLTLNVGSFGSAAVGTGGAVQLDGVNDYIEVSHSEALEWHGGALTVEGWFNHDSTDTDASTLFSQPWNALNGYSYSLTRKANGGLRVRADTDSAATSSPIWDTVDGVMTNDEWNHVALVLDDSNNPHVFVNGEEKALAVSGSATISAQTDLNLAFVVGTVYPYGDPWAGDTLYGYKGKVDQIRVSNTARYSSSFTPSRAPTTDSNTLLLLNFEEGSGTTAADSSGHGYTGTLRNSPEWTQGPFSLQTQSDARDALTHLADVQSTLSTQRGNLGAFQSRMEVAVQMIQSKSLEYQAAEARITDVDVAQTVADMVRNQILQQVQTGLLAQADRSPDILLKLLHS